MPDKPDISKYLSKNVYDGVRILKLDAAEQHIDATKGKLKQLTASARRNEWRPYFAFFPVRITHGADGLWLPPLEAIKQPWAWLRWVEKRDAGAWWLPGPVFRHKPKAKQSA